jgi:MFS transporter, DHA1 family, inner membrane transport protein
MEAVMLRETVEESSTDSRRRERLVLFILAGVQFTTIVDFMIVMPLGPQLMRKLEIGPQEFGLIVSSYTFAAGAAGLVASSVVDRFSRRTAFMLLYAGFLLGTLLCALATAYQTLVLARTVTGAFGGILGGMTMTIIGDVFPEHRRGRATGSLMTGFSLATVAGVPFGLYLGTSYGWQFPFYVLVAAGVPTLLVTPFALPKLDDHVRRVHAHPWRSLVETFTQPNHLNAFALISVLMIAGFSIFPYISEYFVANMGMSEDQLPLIFIVGGGLTLLTSPLIGRLADRFGKFRVYSVISPFSAGLFLLITHLPAVGVIGIVLVYAALMVCNVGRMIAAMALMTGSVEPHRRGGFLSANSSVQHIASGLAAYGAGFVISESADGKLEHFGTVGWIGAAATLASIWLASRIKIAQGPQLSAAQISLAAAAEATVDAGEPLMGTLELERE